MIGKCCAICAHAVLDATSFQLTSGQRRLVLVVSEVFAGEYGAGRGGNVMGCSAAGAGRLLAHTVVGPHFLAVAPAE